jgi:hypothetical protein
METPIIDISDARIKRLKNLRGNVGKTDEELRQMLLNKKPKERAPAQKADNYDVRFNEKMKILQQEYAIDTNNSNDFEALKSLVRFQIQAENVDRDISAIQRQESMTREDYGNLKNLGDFQKTIATSINEIQDKLGITRKIRKEKTNDDIPLWMDSLLVRAENFFEIKTVQIECPKCQIELARYWLNFPLEKNQIDFELTCWKCKESVLYSG